MRDIDSARHREVVLIIQIRAELIGVILINRPTSWPAIKDSDLPLGACY
jgi:hypothetical protein